MNAVTGEIRPMTPEETATYAPGDRLPSGEVAVSRKVGQLLQKAHRLDKRRRKQRMAKASRKVNRP